MKTLALLSFLAALSAFALSLLSLEAAASALLITGLAAILLSDYTRRARVFHARRTPRIPAFREIPGGRSPAPVLELAA